MAFWRPFETDENNVASERTSENVKTVEYDFELFNYSIHEYIELGVPDKDPSSLLAAITLKDFRHNELPKVY
ncbi:hypothetical protein NQ318_013102 [Aromia moschata]|uniref:Uncharacterized protein n=1 Tax=Aromia moschata TaxID=1265417 RepID=A0AAV8Y403_9CUCU|nr:hypothetical protein NQ318_013102 [Aromia moschata]